MSAFRVKYFYLNFAKSRKSFFGSICVDVEYRRRMNHELFELHEHVELARRVKIQRLRWLGHVFRMT